MSAENPQLRLEVIGYRVQLSFALAWLEDLAMSDNAAADVIFALRALGAIGGGAIIPGPDLMGGVIAVLGNA